MQNFFEALQVRKEKLGIADVQISLTTLDEVFLNIAKQAELESAADEGRFETVHLSDGVSIQATNSTLFYIHTCMHAYICFPTCCSSH